MSKQINSEQISTSYREVERQRQAIKENLAKARSSLVDALQDGTWSERIQEIAQLEDQLAIFDNFIREKKEQEKHIYMLRLQEKLESNRLIMDSAEEQEAVMLHELDTLFEELKKRGRDLLQLRNETLAQLESTAKDRALTQRTNNIGKIGWDIKRFFFTYEVARGRMSRITPMPPDW